MKVSNGQVNSLVYGKNDRNWAIRSQVPKPVMLGYGKGSTTKRDGLESLTNSMIAQDIV